MKKGIKVYQIIQYLISLFLCLMIGIFPGDEESLVFLSGPLKYLPIVLWGINLVCFILEFIKKRAYIRLIYLIVTSVIIAVSIPDYVLIGDMVIIFGLVYLIMMLVVTIKGETFVKAKEVADNNILQVGFFNRKQRKQTYLVFGLSFLVAFLVVFLLDICFEVGLLISMLIAFPLVFAFIMIGRDIVVDAIRMIVVEQGTVIAASKLGKLKTVTQMIALILILAFPGVSWMVWFAYIAAVASLVSGVDYFVKNRKVLLSDLRG